MAVSAGTGQGDGQNGEQGNGRSTGVVVFRFDQWVFNADTGDVSGGDAITRLEPKVAALLRYFLTHQHKLITRDELLATVWGGRSVSDDAITRCVSILRQLLSPDDKHLYIETVVRKGYITHFPPPPEEVAPPRQPLVRRRFLLLAAVACVLAIGLSQLLDNLGAGSINVPPARTEGPPLVAVLPFATLGDDEDTIFFADGMFEDLLTQLSQLQAVRVISSTSAREYRNVARNIRQVGQELGADVIIEGSVQLAGDRIRINAQLIDARTDEHLWARRYDRDLTLANVFDIQSEIASAITSELKATLTRADQQQLALIPTENMAAYRAYHRAIHMRETRGYSMISQPEYLQALEEAVALDPGFTRALAELVSTLAFADFQDQQPEMTRRAEQALEQLQAAAPGSADHLFGQAAYVYYALRDFDRAHDILTQALELRPSDVDTLQVKSWIERRQGDYDAYLRTKYEIRRLDPRDPAHTDQLLFALWVTHRYDQAWIESQNTRLQSFGIERIRLLHRLREDQDISGFESGIAELCQRYPEPQCGWTAHVANRNYPGALASLGGAETAGEAPARSQTARRWLFTLLLMDDVTPLAPDLPRWQAELARGLELVEPYHRSEYYLGLGLLAAIEGDVAAADEWLQRWERNSPVDQAERALHRHEVCRVRGKLADARGAAQCIRTGLANPSLVTPFMEVALPFYDSVRDSPEFAELLAQLQSFPQPAPLSGIAGR